MFSERVVQALTALGGKGFVAYPVVIESSHDPRLAKLQAPNYFYLSVCGEIKIDWQRSGLNEPCPVCGAPLRPQIRAPRRLIPVDGSWDGSDIFYGSPYGGPFCTDRVFALASQQRWTNFRFYPIDAEHEEKVTTAGIDYLGKTQDS